MSEEDQPSQEPSMEDILASISRILSEDAEEEGAKEEEAAEPEPEPEPEPVIELAEPEPEPEPDKFLELTPSMVASPDEIISERTVQVSTDVLSQLARTILDQRDIAVGSRDLTLEGMVRQMLRPILREWLDRNLPYLTERLVKKEIDLMVNRAEGLDN